MKNRYILYKIILWIFAVLWMGVIYLFSSADGIQSSSMSSGVTQKVIDIMYEDFQSFDEEKQNTIYENVHFYVRKTAHFMEYAVLGFIFTALMFVYDKKEKYSFVLSTLLAGIYAITDEIHQSFVAGRSPAVRDVCIDTAGAFVGSISLIILIFILNYSKLLRYGRKVDKNDIK